MSEDKIHSRIIHLEFKGPYEAEFRFTVFAFWRRGMPFWALFDIFYGRNYSRGNWKELDVMVCGHQVSIRLNHNILDYKTMNVKIFWKPSSRYWEPRPH